MASGRSYECTVASIVGLAVLRCACAWGAESAMSEQLPELSLEQLANLEVTSVSKAAEPLSQAPASIYVITHEEIVRSGATSIAQALRLAPNLLVTQLTTSNYAASARGLGGNVPDQNFSNKLLVLIDGRSVYSPLYSGVYLEVQDVVMQDIDRIEVISGPGATLWGANAVNGVINIITRPAYLTRGALVDAEGGNLQQQGTLRYGTSFNEDTSLRVYGKSTHDGSELQPDGLDPHDSWNKTQGGFRLDWAHALDSVTVQGDAYRGLEHAAEQPGAEVSGANLLARWERTSGDAQWEVQSYVDQTERGALNGGDGFLLQTYDILAQETLALGVSNRVVWGAGYRINNYDITSTPNFQWIPSHRALTLGNLFGQDTYTITSALKLTGGLKLEDDPYSGWQALPDLRLAWTPAASTLLWTAVSRAVRSPTPFDDDVLERVPPVQLSGDHGFRPEKVWDEEFGLRIRPLASLSWSATAFSNQYSDLRTVVLTGPAPPPILLALSWGNSERGANYGIETWADWQVNSWWRLSPGLRAVHEHFSFVPGMTEAVGLSQAGDDPSMTALLTTSMEVGRRWSIDATWRYVGALPNPALPSYQELDAHISWHATQDLEIGVGGNNLLHAHHLEYPGPAGEYIDRAVIASVIYRTL